MKTQVIDDGKYSACLGMDNDMYIVTRYMSLLLLALMCNYTYVIFLTSCFHAIPLFFNGASLLSLVFQMRLLEVFIKCSM